MTHSLVRLLCTRAVAALLLGVAMTAASTAVRAQTYPDRPLRLVVGFPPGGSGDFLARIIADELTREIGQPVVVDNRPGAGSNIAAEHVARAAADGYTISGAKAIDIEPADTMLSAGSPHPSRRANPARHSRRRQ